MSDDMVKAIIAETKQFQAEYRREQAEQAARVARVGDDLTPADREEISRLSGTSETPSQHASEIDRLLSVAEEVQEKPHERAGRPASDDEWRDFYGPRG